jgi:hypothetical protein
MAPLVCSSNPANPHELASGIGPEAFSNQNTHAMKTTILGYADAQGKGAAKVIAAAEVPIADQIKTFAEIKTGLKYPPGIVRVEFCELIPRNVGIKLAPQPEAEAVETKHVKAKK